MTGATEPPAALDDLRVLDLTGEIGVYCPKLLADLGADVIRVEPPGGHPIRRIGPFVGDDPDPEKSLHHLFFNTSKRGVTLDIEQPDGRDLLRQLVATADVVVESYPPGYLDGLELGYAALSKGRPELIWTSITPFGLTGPWRDYKATDIVGDAMGGLMYVTGNPDGPPILSAPSQAYFLASEQAAVGTMLAVYHRDLTGEGQQVDVSMQEAVATAVQPQTQFWHSRHEIPGRFGYGQRTRTQRIYASSFYPCKDGWVVGLGAGQNWAGLVGLLEEQGYVDDLDDPKYATQDGRIDAGAHIQAVLERFAASFTMNEIVEAAQRYHLFVFPTNTARDIVEDPHLAARNFFVLRPGPDGSELTFPGAPYRLSETPWRLRPAPRIGEHNLAVWHEELEISKQRLVTLKGLGVI